MKLLHWDQHAHGYLPVLSVGKLMCGASFFFSNIAEIHSHEKKTKIEKKNSNTTRCI